MDKMAFAIICGAFKYAINHPVIPAAETANILKEKSSAVFTKIFGNSLTL